MTRCPLCAGLTHTALHGEYLRCTLCSLAFVPGRSVLAPLDAQARINELAFWYA